jgi:hypothetical protein
MEDLEVSNLNLQGASGIFDSMSLGTFENNHLTSDGDLKCIYCTGFDHSIGSSFANEH